jgi:orotate phosphoribosyltransferase
MLEGEIFEELKDLIKEKALFKGEFKLASGEKSHYYIDARLITLSALGASLIGPAILEAVKTDLHDDKIQAVGGMSVGADPIATAVSIASLKEGVPLDAFIVRKEKKIHGMGRRIEGPVEKGMSVLIVEDVSTTGSSAIKACKACEEAGLTIHAVVTLLDREEGAEKNISREGYKFIPLISISDLEI